MARHNHVTTGKAAREKRKDDAKVRDQERIDRGHMAQFEILAARTRPGQALSEKRRLTTLVSAIPDSANVLADD